MSVNHLFSNHPETLWWTTPQQHPYPIMDSSPTHHHPQPPPTAAFNLNHPQHSGSADITKEAMFEKPLTPSDVGKLNRLVIPKQHAEKYFPLAGGDPLDQQKGLLLTFEDEFGKQWRFRYSYWNSSQSYVLTKGWSRFVKDKRLDAGDVVLFQRHASDCDRLFIGWRRRSAALPVQDSAAVADSAGAGAHLSGWTTRMFYDAHSNYPSHHLPLSYQPYSLHAGGDRNENVENKGKGRRVRLFGVNLECPDESDPSTPDGSTQSSQPHYQFYSNSDHMNIDFNEMRHHHHHQQQG